MSENIQLIEVTPANLASEHICCALSGGKNEAGVETKKNWMRIQMEQGLKFVKADVRGKVFIEYIPAEFAWRPIVAPGYIFIHCLWVSGRFQSQGLAKRLLEVCLKDAKNTNGVVAVSSKQTWLTDTAFYEKHGFEKCDTAAPYFDLVVKRFKKEAPLPHFSKTLEQTTTNGKGVQLYFTDQCPFTTLYVQQMAEAAKARKLKVEMIHADTPEKAQALPFAFGTFGAFLDGQFLTHKLMSGIQFGKKLDKCLIETKK